MNHSLTTLRIDVRHNYEARQGHLASESKPTEKHNSNLFLKIAKVVSQTYLINLSTVSSFPAFCFAILHVVYRSLDLFGINITIIFRIISQFTVTPAIIYKSGNSFHTNGIFLENVLPICPICVTMYLWQGQYIFFSRKAIIFDYSRDFLKQLIMFVGKLPS